MGPVMGNLSQYKLIAVVGAVGGVLCIVSNFDIGGITRYLLISLRQFSRPINELSMQ